MAAQKPLAPWPYPKLFAHRGGGTLAPENTIAAIDVGAQHGYKAVEFDAKLSRDNVSFLLHDDTLERTSNGHGNARDFTMKDLATLDAGAWHSLAFAGVPLPGLDATIAALRRHALMANVEIKPCPGREAETGRQIAMECAAAWAGAAVPPLLSSFSHLALAAAREAAPHLPLGWLTKTPREADWLVLESLNCASFHFWEQAATPAIVQAAHQRGYRVLLWTVNDIARAKALFDIGVDGLFTDNLAEFAKAFH
jgi:glycerophosphoryl diester phosphodiesterase